MSHPNKENQPQNTCNCCFCKYLKFNGRIVDFPCEFWRTNYERYNHENQMREVRSGSFQSSFHRQSIQPRYSTHFIQSQAIVQGRPSPQLGSFLYGGSLPQNTPQVQHGQPVHPRPPILPQLPAHPGYFSSNCLTPSGNSAPSVQNRQFGNIDTSNRRPYIRRGPYVRREVQSQPSAQLQPSSKAEASAQLEPPHNQDLLHNWNLLHKLDLLQNLLNKLQLLNSLGHLRNMD
ncbi:uncharacterized protein LOC122502400 [Leptopilina heterotoma]|uniref:uncharacterized protein LOC122502400 n=1 Tax=Leptopilina heterotoma TaxID=63436 RepID=UPI001CA7C8D6|nr:uncharacterized protein LOC122502400 [Leptopilina heterotoma]